VLLVLLALLLLELLGPCTHTGGRSRIRRELLLLLLLLLQEQLLLLVLLLLLRKRVRVDS
jgi:hypothetical protein